MGISKRSSSKAAAVSRVHMKAAAAAAAAGKGLSSDVVAGMSERKKKAFQRALNSYL